MQSNENEAMSRDEQSPSIEGELRYPGAVALFVIWTLVGTACYLRHRFSPASGASGVLRTHRRHIVNTSRILAVHPLAGGTYEIEMLHGVRLTSGRNFTQAVRLLIGR